jgi:1,4-dihydroxy-2-naphthoyl-CoA hydrolase
MSELPTNASLPGLDSLLGVTIAEASGSRVVLNLSVRPNLHQPNGILHGGVHCALVESAASIGAGLWFGEKGTVVGVSNQTDFLKAVREGDLTAAAEPIHQGRLQQLWVVTITDSQDRLVARGQVRIQNLPALLV